MSDQQIAQDIVRVQQRISRLRGRFGKHWSEVEKVPVQSATEAWNSLGNFALGFRSSGAGGGRHWLIGLLSAGVGWYLSQPGAVRRLWRMVYPYLRTWKRNSAESAAPTSATV